MNFIQLEILTSVLLIFGIFTPAILNFKLLTYVNFFLSIFLVALIKKKELLQNFTLKKLLIFFLIGLSSGLIRQHLNKEEYYTYKTNKFQAVIYDVYKKNENHSLIYLYKFEPDTIESSKTSSERTKHLDENAKFPKNGCMKIKNEIISNFDLKTGSKIIAVGRFFISVPPANPYGIKKRIPYGEIYEIHSVEKGQKSFKEIIRKKIDTTFSSNTGSLFKAIFISDSFAIQPELRKYFTQSGTSHLLGISVLNIAIVSYLVYFFIRNILSHIFYNIAYIIPLNIISQIGALIASLIYSLLIGFEYPILRSLLMSSISLIALYIGKNRSLEILLFSAALILLIEPEAIKDLSFQFSFAAVLGLCLFKAPQIYIKTKIIKILYTAFFSTLFASALTIPISIYHFQTVSLQPFTANFMAIPFTAFIITPLNLIWVILSYFNVSFQFFNYIIEVAYTILIKIAEYNAIIGAEHHFNPINKIWLIGIIICIIFFQIIKERIRYIFLSASLIFGLLSIYNSFAKQPFVLVNLYAIGIVQKDEIIVYPKINFMTKQWSALYNLPLKNYKESNENNLIQKEKSGKIIIANKIGIYLSVPKISASKTDNYKKNKKIKNYFFTIKELSCQTSIIKL